MRTQQPHHAHLAADNAHGVGSRHRRRSTHSTADGRRRRTGRSRHPSCQHRDGTNTRAAEPADSTAQQARQGPVETTPLPLVAQAATRASKPLVLCTHTHTLGICQRTFRRCTLEFLRLARARLSKQSRERSVAHAQHARQQRAHCALCRAAAASRAPCSRGPSGNRIAWAALVQARPAGPWWCPCRRAIA